MGVFDPLTFTRASKKWAFNSAGVLTEYGNNVPVIDYDPATGAKIGVFTEKARTNSVRNNTMQGAVTGSPGTLPTNWGSFGGTSLTRTVVGTGTENGVDYIDIRFAGTTGNTFVTLEPDTGYTLATASPGQLWTASAFVRLVGGSLAGISSIEIIASPQGGSPPGSTVFAPTGTMQRPAVTHTMPANTTACWMRVAINYAAGVAIDVTLRIGLPQLEQGAFATSPIKTTGAAATRVGEEFRLAGGTWFNSSEGTLLITHRGPRAAAPTVTVDHDGITLRQLGTSANMIVARFYDQMGARKSDIYVIKNYVTVLDGADTVIPLPAFAQRVVGYKEGSFANAVNGGTVQATATPIPLNLGELTIAGFGHVQRILYFPVRLTNAQIQQLSATVF